MDRKTLIRLAAATFVALALGAAVIELTRDEDESESETPSRAEESATDPLRAELIRCQRLGEAGTREAACLRVWAANRERFLAPGGGAVARPSSVEPVRPEAAPR